DSNIGDALHALTRLALTGENIPENAKPLIDKWQPWLEEKLGADTLQKLKDTIHDQAAYADQTRQILSDLGLIADNGNDGNSELDANAENTPEDEQSRDNAADEQQEPEHGDTQARGEAQESSDDSDAHGDADADDRQDIGEEDFDGDSDAEKGGEEQKRRPGNFSHDPQGRYSIYTRAFDEIIAAEDLAEPEELTRLRALLDKQLHNVQGVVSKLANRLQRKLMAQQQRSWQFDLEEGVLDAAKLTRIITGADTPRA
ncbi:MAG: cobaltochelatase subunit CobT, partial [Phototrophicales bacterium]